MLFNQLGKSIFYNQTRFQKENKNYYLIMKTFYIERKNK